MAWWIGEGVQLLFLPYYQFFLARFARQYYTNTLHVYILPCSMFSTEWSSFLYISLIQITSHPLLLWKRISIFFLTRITRFLTIEAIFFLGEDPRLPFPTHLQYQNLVNMSCVFVKRRDCSCTKNMSLPKINMDEYNCLESRFKPYVCRRERTTTTLCFLSSSSFFFFFWFSKIIGKLDPPPLTKIPGSASAVHCY